MKPNEALAVNLSNRLERMETTAHALGKAGVIPQKTVWSCMTGTVAPSVNTVFKVCDAVYLDASIVTRKEFSPHTLVNSRYVGSMADALMELTPKQLRYVAEVIRCVKQGDLGNV